MYDTCPVSDLQKHPTLSKRKKCESLTGGENLLKIGGVDVVVVVVVSKSKKKLKKFGEEIFHWILSKISGFAEMLKLELFKGCWPSCRTEGL